MDLAQLSWTTQLLSSGQERGAHKQRYHWMEYKIMIYYRMVALSSKAYKFCKIMLLLFYGLWLTNVLKLRAARVARVFFIVVA